MTSQIISCSFLSVSPSFKRPNIVKNMSLALVSGGNLVDLEGNGKVGEGGLEDDAVGLVVASNNDFKGLGDLRREEQG